MTDFDEYIRAEEPGKRQRAENWRAAIGLQDVDGLKTSDYLRETAQRNIEGEITIDEARQMIHSYYEKKTIREDDDEEKSEADKVSLNIAKLLGEPSFMFSVVGFTGLHRRIFSGVLKHAGEIRDYDISKKEWVLRGASVDYGYSFELRKAIEYDLQQESEFSYRGLSADEMVAHVAKFVSGLWQIHPFGEGNTRTTAVFTIKYLRHLGFQVNNDLFAEKSWYFRNALVRANYRNVSEGVDYEPLFLILFFRNLLLGEHHELRNRYMLINPPEEWQRKVDELRQKVERRTSTPQVPHKYPTSTPQVDALINVVGEDELTIREMMAKMGLKDRKHFAQAYLDPSISEGAVRMLYPESPRHPRQKYLLTPKGLLMYKSGRE